MYRFQLLRRFTVVALAVTGLTVLGACESTPSTTSQMPEFSITPSRTTSLAGETVTFTSRSANVAGTNSQIEWHTTGGDLQEQQNGRTARVTFDEPGTYNVTAQLMIDGTLVNTDTKTVVVEPVTNNPVMRDAARNSSSTQQQESRQQDLNRQQDQERQRQDTNSSDMN